MDRPDAPRSVPPSGLPGTPRLPILFEDRWLVAIRKPAGLSSVPSEGDRGKTCISELRASHPTALAVHRIDRDVSGVLLFALNEGTRVAMEEKFRERLIDKVYLAVVNGIPARPTGTIRKPIADLGKQARTQKGGAPAITHYKVKERFGAHGRAGPAATLVEVRLETGRYNQIRVHFAAIGHPLVGERKYARGKESVVRFRRVALHAWQLAFDHPHERRRVELTSPLPDDLEGLLTALRSSGPSFRSPQRPR